MAARGRRKRHGQQQTRSLDDLGFLGMGRWGYLVAGAGALLLLRWVIERAAAAHILAYPNEFTSEQVALATKELQ
jgi:hypothetical protein